MIEKIKKIYNDKSEYYIDILNKIKDDDIDFVMLNYIIPDDNPGDMDILINGYDKLSVQNILLKNGFNYYTNIDSSQILFNKYISQIGFIQFHLFIGLSFMNKSFFNNIPKIKGIQSDINFSFLVFLMESFYRNKFKYYVYEQYKKQLSFSNFNDYVFLTLPSSKRIIDRALEIYSKKYNDNNRNLYVKVILNNYKLLTFVLNKISRKLKRIRNKEDLFVLFIGVDGSGKTFLVNESSKVLLKGGIFPIPKYLGLNNSKISKLSKFLIPEKKKVKVNNEKMGNEKNKLDLFKKFQVILFWLEYNFRVFFQIKLLPTSAKSIYLIDRSYLDLLYYHKNNFAKLLFLKYSFKPTHLVYLTGESSKIYERKKEGSIDLHENRILFYNKLYDEILINKKNKIQIDTIKNSASNCTHMILDFVLYD
jgi:thymidylate kinase